jgi:hypothetical protein
MAGTADDIRAMMRIEWESLRKEQEFLKRCQLQYFLFSITVVGLFVGASHLSESDPNRMMKEQGWVFLAPLIVTIPCWWIFFDKCKTIARLVGYLRIVEELACSDKPDEFKLYIGWERSIGSFRTDYTADSLRRNENIYNITKNERRLRLLSFHATHKYWIAHYYCFLFISLICIILARHSALTNTVVFSVSVIAVVLIAMNTFEQLDRLIFGKNSYDAHEEKWWDILEIQTGRSLTRGKAIREARDKFLRENVEKFDCKRVWENAIASIGFPRAQEPPPPPPPPLPE